METENRSEGPPASAMSGQRTSGCARLCLARRGQFPVGDRRTASKGGGL